MKELAIFLPTYKRPKDLQRVATNIEETTKCGFTLYFGLEPDDKEGFESAKATGHRALINPYEMGYSNTIQWLYENSDEPFFIHANDDFNFIEGWDEGPLSMFKSDPKLMVVGLRQHHLDNHGSAVCMVRRKYIEKQSGVIGIPNRVFYPYNHNYQDTEFTQTAQFRGVWAYYDQQVIEHQHPGLLGKSDRDETYKKNEATSAKDAITFESRKHLWGK